MSDKAIFQQNNISAASFAMRPKSYEHSSPAILSWLKAPRAGEVKTRLAQSIGPEAALKVYRVLVERQLSELPPGHPLEIHYTPTDALDEMRAWLGDEYAFHAQCEGGLGIRLERAVADAFKRGAQSVICIGGDCPKLNRVHLEQTAAALQSDYDIVFGPSEDGGYYLIGLNAHYPEVFQDIPWSTQATLETSLKKSSTLNLRVKLLETLYDIDEIATLNKAIHQGLLPGKLNVHPQKPMI